MSEANSQLTRLIQACFSSGGKIDLRKEVLQPLWSGYGEIARFSSNSISHKSSNTLQEHIQSIIIKSILLKKVDKHPRGWTSKHAHSRKVQSYFNEAVFYTDFGKLLHEEQAELCYVPRLLGMLKDNEEIHLLLEDLSGLNYSSTFLEGDLNLAELVVDWLANFHAFFMGHHGQGLWEVGTYWHLSTRQEEWEKMQESSLKQSAYSIDKHLNNARYHTVLHGDAKLANFCFDLSNNSVASVDFQYSGKGVGVKDLIYFLGSCFDNKGLYKYTENLTDRYFARFIVRYQQLQEKWPKRYADDAHCIEKEWRELICFAWADFERFLIGWSPSHKKLNDYSQVQSSKALKSLNAL